MNNSRCIILHRGLHYCRTSCVFGQTIYLSEPRLLIYEYALSPSVGMGYCYWICDREHTTWYFDTFTQLCPNKTQPALTSLLTCQNIKLDFHTVIGYSDLSQEFESYAPFPVV